MRAIVRFLFLSILFIVPCAQAQSTMQLQTEDVALTFDAASSAPRLKELRATGQPAWFNRAAETLPDHVEINGQVTPITWRLLSNATKHTRHLVSYTYECTSPHLKLIWEWEARADFGPIEHRIRVENLGESDIWLPFQDSWKFDFSVQPGVQLSHFYVEKGADTPSPIGTHNVKLTEGYTWQGYSSTYAHPAEDEAREIIPWSLVQRNSPAQDGWYVGIEFSGRTRLAFNRRRNSLKGAAGLNPAPGPFRTKIPAGESFETPQVFLGGFHSGIDAASNVLRRWVRQVLTNPTTWADPRYPYLVNNSWGSGMAVDEALAHRMIEDSSDLQFEMFHIDAGWFRGVGDWYPNHEKFPHGMAAIADHAHRLGLKFGLWVDWTQAGLNTEKGSLNLRDPKVRDWLVADVPPDWEPEPFKGQTIDIGLPAAKNWAEEEVNRIVSDYHLDMIEHDGYLVAQGCDRSDHPHAPADPARTTIVRTSGAYFVHGPNSTDVSYHAVRAYYDIYARLRKSKPGLLFEICNDGGRMVDFGSASHGDYFSITDTYDPLSNRRAFYDTSFVLPAAMLETYVEKWPARSIENFRYMLRSGMMGWLTIMLDTTAWSAEQHDVAKQEFAIYKTKLRPLIRDAALFHISERPDGVRWDGMEYYDPTTGRGAVYAFRGSTETESSHTFRLKGLDPSRTYSLEFQDHSSENRVATGSVLMKAGLTVSLKQADSSELIFFAESPNKSKPTEGSTGQ
ncbi:MAG: alpha-galactosidase [Acidobacteria bacterium]|nr:alpha-galactosidase [Acidobacteriota bacterium]MBS1866324.1 alpha-galactosidase [Acidobacteriota bacterium]